MKSIPGIPGIPGIPTIPDMPAISGTGPPPVLFFFGFDAAALVSEVEEASVRFVPAFVEINVATIFVPPGFTSDCAMEFVGAFVDIAATELDPAGGTSVLTIELLAAIIGAGCAAEFDMPAVATIAMLVPV